MNDLGHDGTWKRQEIESPCVRVCVINPRTRLCVGCARSLDEIAAWSQMAPETRRAIIADLPGRLPNPRGRLGGRAARLRTEPG